MSERWRKRSVRSRKVSNDTRVLIIDRDKLTQKSLYELLCRANYTVETAGSKDEALGLLEEKRFRIIILSLNKGDLKLLTAVKERSGSSEIIVLTSYGDLEFAVKSIKEGAFDYLLRPVEDRKILLTMEKALANKASEWCESVPMGNIREEKDLFHGLVGKTPQICDIYSLIDRLANSTATVLIRGASGTGKRLVAQAIHQADKERRKGSFVEISCGALPREIIESELFGHTKGAFTGAIKDRKGRFELADGGTLLLDDIDSLSPDLQVKLLRVLQQKEFERVGDHKTIKVDVRIIATTNSDLERLVAAKKFREDLFYRIYVIVIDMPSLKDRKEDVPLLVSHFMTLYTKKNHKEIEHISEETLAVLMEYDWPGNVRQLENIIERAVILDMDGVITGEDLPSILASGEPRPVIAPGADAPEGVNSLKDFLKCPEKGHILSVLEEVGWNKKRAARVLGVNRTTLYNKLRKYNIISA